MKLFPQDSNVDLYKTGFGDDYLERKKISKQLSDLVERLEDPVVIALDDKWGSGKTYFLKRWVAAHTEENNGKAKTVYFDAFENDYLTDPLVSIINAVISRLTDAKTATLKKWKSVATKLVKPAIGIALSAATFGAKQYLEEAGDVIAEAASGEVKNVAQDLWKVEKDRKQALEEFRKLLTELSDETEAPIVIVVDELDRCRPDYALSVLEVIKHFFSVPKVHFILGVNGVALENSVKARYGADIDAESYLRKFINVTFSLPRNIGERGEVSVLAQYASKISVEMDLPKQVTDRCISFLEYVANSRDVSLRDVGKILSKVALLPNDVREGKFLQGYIDILSALLVCSVVDPMFHMKLVSGDVPTLEIRKLLSAPREKTVDDIDGETNPKFDHDLTIWLVTLVFCCGSDDISDVADVPERFRKVSARFDQTSWVPNRKSIAPLIQKDWIDLFKI